MNSRHNRGFSKKSYHLFKRGLKATTWLIIVNVLFFIIAVLAIMAEPDFIKYIALKPYDFMQGKYPWTIITHMFMHAPGAIPIFSAHLLINMFVLFSLGSLCETIIGRRRFLIFYIISGIVAALFFIFLSYFFGNTALGSRIFGSPDISAVGASGAIFAIAGLFVVLIPKARFSILFFPFFSLPGFIMIPLVLFLTWIITSASGFPMGNTAHLGGFLAGLIFGFYLRIKYKRKTKMLSRYFR